MHDDINGRYQIGQRDAIKRIQIALRCRAQYRFQPAMLAQAALIGLGVEALDHLKIGLCVSDDVADTDLLGGLLQAYAATASARHNDLQSIDDEILHDLRQVGAGYMVMVRYFRNRYGLFTRLVRGAVHQYA